MTSEIRTNSLKSRAGLSTVTLTDSGPIFSGITTFLDNSIFNVGNINATGVVTATSFSGSGANLTSLPAQVTIANNADNRVITGGSGVNLNGEANLTWDGSAMGVGLNNPNDTLHVYHATDNLVARFESGDTGGGITLKDNTHVTSLITTNGAFEINVDQGGDITGETIAFKMSGSEKLRIDSSGRFLLGTTTEGEVNADDLTIATSANTGMTIRSGTSNFGSIYFSDGTSGNAEYKGIIAYNHSSDYLQIYTAASERLRIHSTGVVQIGDSTASSLSDRLLQIGKTDRTATYLELRTATNGIGGIVWSDGTANDNTGYRGTIEYAHGGSNSDSLFFKTAATERLRIGSAGQFGIGGANYGTSGQVLTSQGSGSAVQWATPSSGGMTLLASATLSSSGTTAANISFNTAGYEYLYGKLYSVTRSGGANINDIGLRWNGTSSAVYDFVMQRMDGNGSGSERYTQGANQFYYNMNGVAGWTSGRNQAVFELHLVNDGVRKPFNMKHSGELSGGPLVLTTDGMLDLTSSITSLEITTSDTNINGGTLKLYGVK